MACCARSCDSDCECSCHGFTSPDIAARAGARLSRLWDRARDAMSRAGLRPYTVTIVRARAVGQKQRGDGPTEIVGEWMLLPTPKISDLTAISETLSPDQLREAGSIMLSEVSLSYSESVLMGLGESGKPIPAGETVFYEIRYLDGSGRTTMRRRFVTASAPAADMAKAMWTINLSRAPFDRDRGGTLR
jgi:hypothetical protein